MAAVSAADLDCGIFAREPRLLVGGALLRAEVGPGHEVVNPADGSVVGTVPLADDQTVDAAVQEAAEAFDAWSSVPAVERGRYLHEIAGWIREHREQLAALLTLEQGKPLSEAHSEVQAAAKAFDYYAEAGVHLYGDVIPTESSDLRSLVIRQPSGVVAAIATWNYPLGMFAWKAAPALAAGCTVVAKPALQTPLSTLALAHAAEELGLPPGVLNLVAGRGEQVGERLVTHPLVRHVTFTGGTQTGRRLLELSARNITRCTLELGGGSPMIVAADAPLDRAVADGMKRGFRNAGQLCNSVQQVFVEHPLAEEFTERFVAAVERQRVGPGYAQPEPHLGPLSGASQLARVERHVADARDKGATVLTGGRRPDDAALAAGWFYLPTVVADVPSDALVSCEETFGPVVAIVPVDTLDEAFERANAGEAGLVAYLYTTSLRLAHIGAERLQYGTVNVNNVGGGDVPYPYAGWKHSGLGVELGHSGLESFLEVKHVRLDITG